MEADSNGHTWPADTSSSPRETLPEKVTGYWEQPGEYDPRVVQQLTLAKASRSEAETARQKIAEEILDATREKCQQLIASGNRALENARRLETEADWTYTEAQGELERAGSIKGKAEAERDRIIAEARQQAKEVVDIARLEAERDRVDMKHLASLEAQRILAQAHAMREATREELEAQRIYSEAAKLKAWSHDILALAGEQPSVTVASPAEDTNGSKASAETGQEPENGDGHEPPSAEQTPVEEPSEQEEPVDQADPVAPRDEKKAARGAKVSK